MKKNVVLYLLQIFVCSILLIGCSPDEKEEDTIKALTQEEIQQLHQLQTRRAVLAEQDSLRSQGFRVEEGLVQSLSEEELQQLQQLEQRSQQTRATQQNRTTVIDTGKPVGY